MKSFVVALVALGSLTGCAGPRVFVMTCIGAPPIPLRDKVIDSMNREELVAYNNYKAWWQKYCSETPQ